MRDLMTRALSRRTFLGAAGAAATVAGLGLAGCGGGGGDTAGSGESGSTGGGTLTVGVGYSTNNFTPANASSALALGANWHVVEGLYELDLHDFTTRPALAADEPVEVDETTFDITLREGAKFSDGTAVTADDVVSSYERNMVEGGLYVPMLAPIASIEKKDDTTVTVKTNYPFALLKERLSLVKVVPTSATDDDLAAMPIGSGPWKYDSINEQAIEFSKNENYNGEFPASEDTMHWDILVDDTARTTAAQEGTTVIMENVPEENRAQLEGAGMTVETVKGFNLPFLMFNTKKAPFDNKLVRQACLYAMDVETMIANALSGQADPATSFLNKDHANYHEAATIYSYDIDKAKELIAEAGVTPGSIVLSTTDHGWIENIAAVAQQGLQEIGFTCEIKSEASSSLYANNCDTDAEVQPFDIVLAPGDPSVFGNDPDLMMNWWYGDGSWTQKRSSWKGSEGYTQLHTLMDQAIQSSGDEQQDLWNQCFDLLSDEVPLYPLLHRSVNTGYYADKVENFSGIGTTGITVIGASAK